MTQLSRREFAALAGATFAAPLAASQNPSRAQVSAQDVIDRIKKNLGSEWKPDTVDGVKAGDPSIVLKGIVTTSMATLDVLQRSGEGRRQHGDHRAAHVLLENRRQTPPPPRAVVRPPQLPNRIAFSRQRHEFIKRQPAGLPVQRALALEAARSPRTRDCASLGWTRYQAPNDPLRFDVPALTLDALAANVKKNLESRGGIRVIGDPATRRAARRAAPGNDAHSGRAQDAPRAWMPSWPARSANGSRPSTPETRPSPAPEGFDSGRPCRFRGARHEGLRRLAQDVRDRSTGPAHSGRRSVLETGIMTAGEVIDRIKKNLGVPGATRRIATPSNQEAPIPSSPGIATTAFVSLEVIERAGAAGLNMIIPHEDTFWNDRDDADDRQRGSVLQDQGRPACGSTTSSSSACTITCTRSGPTSPMWDRRAPIGLDSEVRNGAGLAPLRHSRNHARGSWRADVQKRSGARALRVAGEPERESQPHPARCRIRHAAGRQCRDRCRDQRRAAGNRRRLDSPAYVLDAVTLGIAKGWIMLGHAISEEAGMLEMADWIKGFVPELPVQLVKAEEPFWVPE